MKKGLLIGALVGMGLLVATKAGAASGSGSSGSNKSGNSANKSGGPGGPATLPRGIRNNNPGNIRRGTADWRGKIKHSDSSDTAFEQFVSPVMGIRALLKLLVNYITIHKKNTIRLIINKWAPPSENDTQAYVNFVANAVGISADKAIAATDATTIIKIGKAITVQENTRNPYSDQNFLDAWYYVNHDGGIAGIGATYTEAVEGLEPCTSGKYTDKKGAGACSKNKGLLNNSTRGGKNCAAIWLPINWVFTDPARFQNRDEDYSEESVNKIIANYDENRLDPITVWQDPANSRYYVLSGHSRFEALTKLGKTRVPARFFHGSLAEAKEYGLFYANRSGTPETLREDLKLFKMMQAAGTSASDLRTKWGKNYNTLSAYVFLNPKGKFLEVLGTPAARSFPYVENRASWAGRIRQEYPNLTNYHEDEIFDFFFHSPKGSKMSKDDFQAFINRVVSRLDFNPDLPLNLEKSGERGVNARSDTAPIMRELERVNNELEDLASRRRKASTQEEKKALNQLTLRTLEEKARLERNLKTVVTSQAALFGVPNKYPPGSIEAYAMQIFG